MKELFHTTAKEVSDTNTPIDRRQAERLVNTYSDLILRLSYTYLKSTADAQDICQTVFLKLLTNPRRFDSPEHEKAWIIRVTVNACRDLVKSFFRSRTVSLDQLIEKPQDMPEDHSDILEAVLELPARFRDVVYLHYYEGYSAPEIGRILKKNPNTVYTLLARARQLLKTRLEGVSEDE